MNSIEQCQCIGWINNFELYEDLIFHALITGKTNQFEGEEYQFCPWCGNKLKVIKTEHELAMEALDAHCEKEKQKNHG